MERASSRTVADNKQLLDVKGGFWQDIYSGAYGEFGGGAPSTDDAIGFTSLRYYF